MLRTASDQVVRRVFARAPVTKVPPVREVLGSRGKYVKLNAFINSDGADVARIKTGIRGDVAVKDNIAADRFSLTCGSGILEQHRSPFEATIVDQVRISGRPIVGKTNLDEFGMGSHSTHSFFGPVHNSTPFDQHSVGGSSGGSAVAVATGQCRTALGTDTGGSVRLPAAYTGIVGFKPSYGLISRWGVVPYANSLDTVGILASSASSIEALLNEIKFPIHDPQDPTSLTRKSWNRMKATRKSLQASRFSNGENGPRTREKSSRALHGLKIGVPVEYNIVELDPGIREAWQSALEVFEGEGCTIVPISLPNTRHALSAYYVLAPAEAASNLSKYDSVRYGTRYESSDGAGDVLYSNTRGEGFGDEVKRRILLGSYTLSSEAIDNYFIKAQKVRRLVQRDFDRVFLIPNLLRPSEQFDLSDMDESVELDNKLGPSQVDFIVCPTAPTPPPTLDTISRQTPVDTYMNDVFTVPASLAGLPAISIPFSIPEEYQNSDTPDFAGIQIIGQYSDDFRVLQTAIAIEKLQKGWKSDRRLRAIPKQPKPAKREPPVGGLRETKENVQVGENASIFIEPANSPAKVDQLAEDLSEIALKIRNIEMEFPKMHKYPVSPAKPARKVSVGSDDVPIIKFPTGKGENRLREPRTDKDVKKYLDDAFEGWDDMVSDKDERKS